MGAVLQDIKVRDAVVKTLADVRGTPAMLDDVFSGRPAAELTEIRGWFGSHEVPVRLGFPREVAEMPGVYVVLHGVQEQRTPVGTSAPDEVDPADGSKIVGRQGTFLAGTVRAMCWSANADLTAWLAAVVAWGLLRERDALSSGLLEQQIGVGDLLPQPQWFPDFVFGRDVTLSAVHELTVEARFGRVSDVVVKATGAPTPPTVYTATLRARA